MTTGELGCLADIDRTEMPSIQCDMWPHAFRVHAAGVEALRWVRAHLSCTVISPWQPPMTGGVTVVAVGDADAVDRIVAEVRAGDTRPVEGFRGQFWEFGAVAGHPAWCRSGRTAIVRTGEDSWFVAARSAQDSAMETVRLCRELSRTKLAALGAASVHAALVAVPEQGGLLLVGAGGSGKTTLALAAAQGIGYVVSSDQTALVLDPSGVVVGVGSPNANRVGPGTLSRLAGDRGDPRVPPLRDSGDFPGNPYPDKTWLTPLESEVLYRIPSASCARVDRIVFLDAQRKAPRPRAVTVSPADTEVRLRAELREPDPLYAGFWLTEPGRDQPRSSTFDDLDRLTEKLPRTLLTWDPRSHEIANALACLRQPT